MADTSGLPSPTWGCLPPGWIGFFAANNAPNGFLTCNGSAVSRITYARLFAVIGTRFGAGDGATTFGIPDLRGKFLRGYFAGVTGAFGAPQDDAIRNIVGSFALRDTTSPEWPPLVGKAQAAFVLTNNGWAEAKSVEMSSTLGAGTMISFDASKNVPTASENRPANVALLPCIKY